MLRKLKLQSKNISSVYWLHGCIIHSHFNYFNNWSFFGSNSNTYGDKSWTYTETKYWLNLGKKICHGRLEAGTVTGHSRTSAKVQREAGLLQGIEDQPWDYNFSERVNKWNLEARVLKIWHKAAAGFQHCPQHTFRELTILGHVQISLGEQFLLKPVL